MPAPTIVRSQAELDAALADPTVTTIHIQSDPSVAIDITTNNGKWIEISGSARVGSVSDSASVGSVYGSARVGSVSGSARVGSVYGSARVGSVYGSARVGSVYGSARVGSVYGSASVGSVYGSARVGSVSGSARVEYVSGSASVGSVYGSARVGSVSDSARVGYVYGSASVESVSGSASVESVSDSASVGSAGGTAVVHLYDASSVKAGSHVTVYLHSARATVTGGVVIDLTQLDLTDPRTWCEHHGVDITSIDGQEMAVLYKAVDGTLTAGQQYGKPTVYTVGTTVACPDWRDDRDCGGGLHVSPRPDQARRCAHSADKVRYLRVHVPIDTLRPIEADKAKAPAVYVAAEVDIFGRELTAAVTL